MMKLPVVDLFALGDVFVAAEAVASIDLLLIGPRQLEDLIFDIEINLLVRYDNLIGFVGRDVVMIIGRLFVVLEGNYIR